MKKVFAIILILLILVANWYVGYDIVPNFWFGLLWILIGIILSSIGALVGIFIINALKKY
jgi:hypothetical protein